jgi:hypothetical protein
MKKLLLSAVGLVVAAGVVVGGGNAVDNHYQAHKNKQVAQQASAVEVAKKAQYDADQSRYSLLVKQYSDLQAQCEKGTAAYAKLSAVLKASTPSPQCTAPAAQ